VDGIEIIFILSHFILFVDMGILGGITLKNSNVVL